MKELWTPQGSTLTNTSVGGFNTETGESITLYTFSFSDPETGQSTTAIVPADPTMSAAHIEDMAAQALEQWLEDVRFKDKGKVPTDAERKDIGKQLNEFKKYAAKRRESTNNKVYYSGVSFDD
tara:strand:+ start:163 stop:531 length:369 start_codon:yes stop_codon:yes gene_type:complete